MFDVGVGEVFFLGIIAVIVLGPDRLPEAIRAASKAWVKFSRFKDDFKKKINIEFELSQLRDELKTEINQVKQLEKQLSEYLTRVDDSLKSDASKYYPIENFQVKIPFQHHFTLLHLMQSTCFSFHTENLKHQVIYE